jgi:hypothetical protein
MDPDSRSNLRFERLAELISVGRHDWKRARRARILVLLVLGGWLIVPALFLPGDWEDDSQAEFFRHPTPHEGYLMSLVDAELVQTALGRDWVGVAENALFHTLTVGPAYLEEGIFPSETPLALGFRLHILEGQRLTLTVAPGAEEAPRLFVDLYRAAPDTLLRPVPVESGEMGEDSWRFDVTRTDDYVLRLQPELLKGGRYRITIRVGAPLFFPVAGGNANDIGSIFGDPRDAGRREHHGVDIFARRGTPVLAAADGQVTSVANTGIGGRVIWQREAEGRHSIYYAHLDTQLVSRGQRVRTGDTIGLVGNTGNARTTPPHLHFGVYRRGRGPVDPWNMILPPPPPFPRLTSDLSALGEMARVTEEGARLFRSTSSGGAVLAEVPPLTPIRVVGAAGGWYRVLLPDGGTGYADPRFVEIAALEEETAANGRLPPP